MPHCPEGLVLALWRECTPPGRTTHLTQTSSHPVLHEPSDCNDMSAGCVCTRVVGGIMHPRSRFALWWTKPVSLERQSHPPAQHLNDPKQGAHHCRIMRPDMLATVAACSAPPPPVTRSPPLTPATPLSGCAAPVSRRTLRRSPRRRPGSLQLHQAGPPGRAHRARPGQLHQRTRHQVG